MMRKNNNGSNGNRNNGGMKHRERGGNRRYNSGGRSSGNDSGNITRQKHHATSMREKFSNLARDAQHNGDRVDVEYYLQHVEHYTRVLAEIAAIEFERYGAPRETQPVGSDEDGNSAAEESAEGDAPYGQEQSRRRQEGNRHREPRENREPREGRERGRSRRPYVQPSYESQFIVPPSQAGGEAHAAPQHSGTHEAESPNQNTVEIPLPGSILPPL